MASNPGTADPAVVAILNQGYPVPPDAGTPRAHHLLRRLCERARVHCLAVLTGDRAELDDFLARSELATRFASLEVLESHAAPSWRSKALSLLTGSPPFDARFRHAEALQRAGPLLRRRLAQVGPAVVYGYGIETLQWVPRDLWGSCVVDCTDAQSLLVRRRIRSDASLSWSRRIELALALPLIRRYEATMFREAAAVVYNSSDDIRSLLARHPGAPLVRVIDGCDTDYFRPDSVSETEEEDLLVFTGHMAYPPNADAAVHLAEDVMPRVWRRRPGARAMLIGPEPPPRLQRLHDGRRVFVTGFVEDVRPHLARATVVVSPVRFGAGMKNKLQAALAMEKATVASPVTCEGFDDVEHGRHVLIAEGAEALADAIVSLLEDPARRAELGRAGGRVIRERYGWDAAADVLWDTLRGTPPTREGSASPEG